MRRKGEEDLGRLRFQAWRADRWAHLSAFAAALAHDLRQPLDAALHNAEAAMLFLDQEDPDLGEIRDILNDIVLDNMRASAVIGDTIAGLRRKETRRDNISLAVIIRETLNLMNSEILGQEVQCEFCCAADCAVSADGTQIRQVLINMITNALEAMQSQPARGRRLKVTLALAGPDMTQVTVSDSGPGVSGSQSLRLFDPFSTTKEEATGLGLAICRSIVQAHGGSIGFRNNHDGGAAFYFTLPLAATLESKKQGSESPVTETSPYSREGVAELTGARILLADDSEPYRRALRSILADAPLLQIVGEAADGFEAAKMAEDMKPDLILLDVRLPGMNGIEAAARIRQVSPTSKILFISNYDDPDVVQAVLRTGALGYVLKVAAGKELLPAVAAVLRGEKYLCTGVQGRF